MLRRYLLLVLFAASLATYAQDARVVTRIITDAAPAWKVWQADGFSMNYPSQWAMAVPAQGDTVVIFSEDEQDPGTVQVSVMDMKNTPVTRTGTDKELLDEYGGTSDNPRMVFDSESNGVPMRVMEQLVSEDGRPFKFVYRAPLKSFDEFLYMAEAMINSFATVPESR